MLSRPTLFKNNTTDTLITRCGVLQTLAEYSPVQTFFPPFVRHESINRSEFLSV